MKMKADSEDKYKVVYATGDTGDDNAVVEEIDTAKMRGLAEEATNKNKDGDTIKYVGSLGSNFYLVNTSGTIVKNKTAAKDGDDWYFYLNDKRIVAYTNTKTIKDTEVEDWKSWSAENTFNPENGHVTIDGVEYNKNGEEVTADAE